MSDTDFRAKTTLGRTGLEVSRIGLASGYGAPERATERAFHEYGINFFWWDRRKPGMKQALRGILKSDRERAVVAIQSYDHTGLMLRRSTLSALRDLQIDYADVLFLGWIGKIPGKRILGIVERLKDEGKIRFFGFSGHNRLFHGEAARLPASPFDVQMLRYNAAHRGAETDIFADLPADRPGIATYTATRWGKLLDPKKMPPGERPLTPAECYRFVLSHPAVDVCMAGPKTETEMEQGLEALDEGPLSDDDLERIRRIGDHVHG